MPGFRRMVEGHSRWLILGLMIIIAVLGLQLLKVYDSRAEWKSRYLKAISDLDALMIEGNEIRQVYESLVENQCDYWDMHGVQPTFVISTDGVNCHSKNVKTGEVDSDPDAARVIQRSIDSLPWDGGKILFRNGTYLISTNLTDGERDFVIIQGEGWGTVLKMAEDTQKTVLDVTDQIGWIISDIAIDGNKAGNKQVPGGVPNDMNQNGIHLFMVSHSRVIRCHVYDTIFHGINIHYLSTNNIVEDCLVERCGSEGDYGASSGILVFSSSQGNVVRRNRCIDNHARGIYISANSSNCVISENVVTGGGAEVAQGIIVMDRSNGVEVRNNTIFDVPGNGIDIGNRYGPGYREIRVTGNTIIDAGYCGIWASDGGSDAIIADNYIRDSGFYAIWTQGTGGSIEENLVVTSSDYKIQADDLSTGISGNVIIDLG